MIWIEGFEITCIGYLLEVMEEAQETDSSKGMWTCSVWFVVCISLAQIHSFHVGVLRMLFAYLEKMCLIPVSVIALSGHWCWWVLSSFHVFFCLSCCLFVHPELCCYYNTITLLRISDIGQKFGGMMHSRSFSHRLSREYRVARNLYIYRLLFTSEDRFCSNLCMQKQSTNMTSQCQYPMLAWHHRSTVVTSQY